ncbi:539_t:CDS:2 [Paraglomus brasilianum]|uniref:539_t:CDS:1 n=1 Tax=Paraglomus brasilianum TaxID=144538 RepID=A0A9N9C6G6_9GLOM|nr:539_t:CDS:2 [Paraglomus brasilianum]
MPPMSSGYGGASVDEPCYVLYSMASSPGSWHCMSVEVIEMAVYTILLNPNSLLGLSTSI